MFYLGLILGFAVGGLAGYFIGRNYGTLKKTSI
jgi:hypothetical protein